MTLTAPGFPSLKRAITDFIFEEEGYISRGKMLTLGTLMVVAAFTLAVRDAFASHGSHASHASHASHESHESHVSGGGGGDPTPVPPPPPAPTLTLVPPPPPTWTPVPPAPAPPVEVPHTPPMTQPVNY